MCILGRAVWRLQEGPWQGQRGSRAAPSTLHPGLSADPCDGPGPWGEMHTDRLAGPWALHQPSQCPWVALPRGKHSWKRCAGCCRGHPPSTLPRPAMCAQGRPLPEGGPLPFSLAGPESAGSDPCPPQRQAARVVTVPVCPQVSTCQLMTEGSRKRRELCLVPGQDPGRGEKAPGYGNLAAATACPFPSGEPSPGGRLICVYLSVFLCPAPSSHVSVSGPSVPLAEPACQRAECRVFPGGQACACGSSSSASQHFTVCISLSHARV